MPSEEAHKDMVLRILRDRNGPVRLKEFMDDHQIQGVILRRLVADGRILNPVRGVYMLKEADAAMNMSLAAIAARGQEFVVALRSAAAFHGLVDRHDARLWLAMRRGVRGPAAPDGHRVVPVRWAGLMPYDQDTVVPDTPRAEFSWLDDDLDPGERIERHFGVDREWVHGVQVRVTTPERTVCDLIRYLGRRAMVDHRPELVSDEGVATEALKALVERQNLPALEAMAGRLGCEREIRPYLATARRMAFGG